MDTYKCRNCKDEWEFFPEDYDNIEDYPEICPLCSVPFWQMVKDTWEEGGIKEVIYHIRARYFN
jgi:DNA-directed RNA polymerase subunit RPC12/RpoP